MYICEFCGKEYLNFDQKESCYRTCLKNWMVGFAKSFGPASFAALAAERQERRQAQERDVAGNLTSIWASLHREPLAKETIYETFMWFWSRFWPSETVSVSGPPQYPDGAP